MTMPHIKHTRTLTLQRMLVKTDLLLCSGILRGVGRSVLLPWRSGYGTMLARHGAPNPCNLYALPAPAALSSYIRSSSRAKHERCKATNVMLTEVRTSSRSSHYCATARPRRRRRPVNDLLTVPAMQRRPDNQLSTILHGSKAANKKATNGSRMMVWSNDRTEHASLPQCAVRSSINRGEAGSPVVFHAGSNTRPR